LDTPVLSVTPDLRVTFPAYAGTHCTYPRRDGHGELTFVAGHAPRQSPIPTLPKLDVEQLLSSFFTVHSSKSKSKYRSKNLNYLNKIKLK